MNYPSNAPKDSVHLAANQMHFPEASKTRLGKILSSKIWLERGIGVNIKYNTKYKVSGYNVKPRTIPPVIRASVTMCRKNASILVSSWGNTRT